MRCARACAPLVASDRLSVDRLVGVGDIRATSMTIRIHGTGSLICPHTSRVIGWRSTDDAILLFEGDRARSDRVFSGHDNRDRLRSTDDAYRACFSSNLP